MLSQSLIEKPEGGRPVLREHVSQRAARLVFESFADAGRLDPIEAEVAEAGAHLAPRGQRPRLSPEEHAERTHRPLGRLAFLIRVTDCAVAAARGASRATASPAAAAPCFCSGGTNSRVSASSGSNSFGRTPATLPRIDSLARQRRIAELGDDPRAEDQCLDFFPVEHQWW